MAEPGSTGAMDWNVGPTAGSLGALGTIKVPTSYKFLAAGGAQTFLQDRSLATPKGLLGVLAPGSLNWWVELRFTDRGYVSAPEKETLDPTQILNKLNAPSPSHASGTTGVEWELKPQYDPATHTLEWAVRTQNGSSKVVVHTVRLLCRRGTVDATVVQAYRGFSDLAPLKALIKDIALKAGEGYADYQNGDKVCSQAFASLVTVEDITRKVSVASATGPDMATAKSHRGLWLGGGALACVALAGGAFFAMRNSRRKTRRERRAQPEAQPARPSMMSAKLAAATVPPTPAPSSAPEPVAAAPAPLVAAPQPEMSRPAAKRPLVMKPRSATKPTGPSFNPKTEALRNPLNGKNHGQRRRKVFDYNRYFTDLMGAVSGHSGQMESTPNNGAPEEPGRPSFPSLPQASPSPAPMPAGDAQAELVASQRELIEEQKRLIQEQNKLIEEKGRLIAEKNQLLKLQNQLMEEKLL